MERGRALLTERERDQLRSGEPEQRVYEIRSHLRTRLTDELSDDLDVLEEHHPDIYEELRAEVCDR